MSLFAFPGDDNRALLVINNEYTNYRYLYAHGGTPQSAEDVHKAQASEGVSVIEVRRKGDTWQFVQDSRYNRRIHGNSPIRLSGPAAGHAWHHRCRNGPCLDCWPAGAFAQPVGAFHMPGLTSSANSTAC